jgi:membrane dipeptidase
VDLFRQENAMKSRRVRNCSATLSVSLVILTTAATGGEPPATQNAGEPARIILTDEARRIHRNGLLIDGHNDLPWQIRTLGGSSFDKMDIAFPQDKLQTDIPRLRRGGVGAQFWVVYAPPDAFPGSAGARMVAEQFDLIQRMAERYPDVFEMAYSPDDVLRIHKEGKIASLIGVEGGHMIENSLDKLGELYRRGARYMGLTHSATIDWADSATDQPRHGGLTAFGERVVLEMNRLGMLVDLAHSSHDTMRDTLSVSKAPVINSHSAAYAVARHARNVPDDVLRATARNGGIVMVVFFSGYVHPEGARVSAGYFEAMRQLEQSHPKEDERKEALKAWRKAHPIPRGTVHTVVDHIDYLVQIMGIDHVGLGSDYDGASTWPIQLEDVSGYPYITQELLNRGYPEEQIHKIMGGNLLRVMRQVEKVAREWEG